MTDLDQATNIPWPKFSEQISAPRNQPGGLGPLGSNLGVLTGAGYLQTSNSKSTTAKRNGLLLSRTTISILDI